MIALKPQDTLLALKYWSLRRNDMYLPVRDLAASLDISASEASKGARRLIAAKLLTERNHTYHAEMNSLFEWLSFGVRYAFPTEKKGYGRGMGTAWTCDLVKTEIVPPSPGTVWETPGGRQEGVIIEPFYKGVPLAASQDPNIYQALALLDAIRLGKPRELAIARANLKSLITGKSTEP